MKRVFLYSFALVLAFVSCKKEDDKTEPQTQQNTQTVNNSNNQNKKPSGNTVSDDNTKPVEQTLEAPKKVLHIKNNAEADQNHYVQYQIANNLATKKGVDYQIAISLKTSEPATIDFSVGVFYPNNVGLKIENTTDEFKEYVFDFTAAVDGGFVLFQHGKFVGDVWIESVKITHKGSGKLVALTQAEKRDALAGAMDTWIAGMMEATDGYVTAWDVVNEALSGGDRNGDGIYDLQNYENNNISDPTNVSSGTFYWQAYMGDLEYVRTAVSCARKHFKGNPSDLKLFINDYNLESDWDNNGKLKSLIQWIKKWEADGVTKIDGIGTQMHITCYADDNTQKNKKAHIITMFELMAATGKLVRVSELDMGYNRGGKQNLGTSELTAAEHQKMADFYEFILKEYFRIIPKAQQYGFCQWCLTDAPGPLGSGWRGGEPVGIWTQNFASRKVVYKGFAQGLAERELSGSVNGLGALKTYINRDKHGNFKFSGALAVNELHNDQNGIKNIVKNNFDEIVAGNAMKYASCVDGGGNMNFNNVKQFIEDAKALGLTIFGHTLAWHSQQQPGYLLSLMRDKELEVTDGSEKIDVVDTYFIYNNIANYNMWRAPNKESDGINYSIEIVDR